MSVERDEELERLRRAFLEGSRQTPPGAAGPSADRIWEAAAGRLPPEELRRVLDEVIADPASAESWAIARRLVAECEEVDHAEPRPASRPAGSWRMVWRAAAVVILAAGLAAAWLVLRAPGRPVYRGGESGIESLLPADASLPRDAAVLRWEPAAGARRYNLRLFDTEYRILLVEDGLTSPVFTIPTDVLGGIPDGGEVLWQVEAVLPDGSSVLSETFRARIAGPGGRAAPEGN